MKGPTLFQQALKKMTALNSAMILLVLILYSALIYFFIQWQIYDNLDASIQQAISDFSNQDKLAQLPGNPEGANKREGIGRLFREQINHRHLPPVMDMRLLMAIQDPSGNILFQESVELNERIDKNALRELISQVHDGDAVTAELYDHHYRLFSSSFSAGTLPSVRLGRGQTAIAAKVVAIMMIDPEVRMLHSLFVIILLGTSFGFFMILLAGYYLARRALVPISSSWEKQQQFVADASHEMRTPLAVIKTNAELLFSKPERTIEQESRPIAAILNEATRMGKLVTTLLTLARADSNQLEMQLKSLNLAEILKQTLDNLEPICEMKEITLDSYLEDELTILGDQERLTQLFVILLDNAVKYTSEGGQIKVTGLAKDRFVQVVVEDTGIGMKAEDLPFIFDRFYRGDKVRSRAEGGSGLGLSIAKWIVEKHGGKIKVESTLGVGSKFIVLFPIKKTNRV